MRYKENWQETREHFQAWWNREPFGRPLISVAARRKEPLETLEAVPEPQSPQDIHLGVDRILAQTRNYCRTHRFLAESFPYASLNMGPGSMAAYLGADPVFAPDTVWFTERPGGIEELGDLKYDPENRWWKLHTGIIRSAVQKARGDFPIAIPDVVENIDILSALRGPQNLCYDLIDSPERVHELIGQIDSLYFTYYDAFYDLVKDDDGSSCYTAFSVWGPGKTAKVQCDFSALMSPRQYREFIVPSLRQQLQKLDHSIYHLDGPDAIRHLDALMEIEELDALQWTAGAGQADGGSEKWFPIYEKVRKAGKAMWVAIYDGGFRDWLAKADRVVREFGSMGVYLLLPDMEEEEALELMDRAERDWK